MQTCKTCRWWGEERRECCGFVHTPQAIKDPARQFTVEATAADDSGLDAYLVTGPDFGCIHHAAKEDA